MKKNKTYLKKTYLGPKRRVWHHLGPFSSSRTLLVMSKGLRWPSLAVVGCCGPLWGCVGLPCAAVGMRWLSLAVAGCCGLSWAFVVVWELVGAGEPHQRVTTTRWWWWEVDRANGGGRNPEKLTNESS